MMGLFPTRVTTTTVAAYGLLLVLLVQSACAGGEMMLRGAAAAARRLQEERLVILQLIDASTGRILVDDLRDGDTVNLTPLGVVSSTPELNLVAVDPTGIRISAVKFSNDHVEGGGRAPFSYCGDTDNGTVFNACDDLGLGTNTVSMKLFAVGGARLAEPSFTFDLVLPDLTLQLVEAPSGHVLVSDLQDGATVNLKQLGYDDMDDVPGLNIVAYASSGAGAVSAMKFSNDHVEGGRGPFSYCGDQTTGTGDGAVTVFNACDDLAVLGQHPVSVKLLASGNVRLAEPFYTFDIVHGGGIQDLQLVYVPTGEVVVESLQDGSVIDMGGKTGTSFRVQAVPFGGGGTVGVKFAACQADTAHIFAHCSDHESGEELLVDLDLRNGSHVLTAAALGPNGGLLESPAVIRYTTVNGVEHEEDP